MQSGFINVLDQSGIDDAISRIDLMKDWWIPRGIYCGAGGFNC